MQKVHLLIDGDIYKINLKFKILLNLNPFYEFILLKIIKLFYNLINKDLRFWLIFLKVYINLGLELIKRIYKSYNGKNK